MGRSAMTLMADFSELGNATGIISGMAKTMQTKAYATSVLKMAHGVLSRDFDLYVDGLFAMTPKAFHHVYEWGAIPGDSAKKLTRLWRHTLIGNGANRNASWVWLAAKKAVPSPEQRAKIEHDPMSQLSEEEVAKFGRQRYFFQWKAPVMELNTPVNIEPKNGGMIAFPTWNPKRPIVFSKGLHVVNPGGEETTGSFTAAWTMWWQSEAPRRFDEAIEPVIQSDLAGTTKGMRMAKRSTSKTIGINAIVDYEKSFEMGERWAEADLRRKSTAYRRKEAK